MAVWWCCCCCCRWDALLCVSLGPVKDAFRGWVTALCHCTPTRRHGRPTPVEEQLPLSPLYPGSKQNLLVPRCSFTQEQSQVKSLSFNKWALKLDSHTSWCKTSNTFLLRCTRGSKWHHVQEPGSQESGDKESKGSSLSVLKADANSIHYLAVAEAEPAASCVRYSRSSLAAWKRP